MNENIDIEKLKEETEIDNGKLEELLQKQITRPLGIKIKV